jgi:uncharacterized iron-regulated membrane protein
MNWRQWHRVVGLVILLPLLVVTVTGIILQLRNQFEYLQPATIKNKLDISQSIYSTEKLVEEYGSKNIEQIIFRPGKGSLVIRLMDGDELQLNPHTGEVLKRAQRRTNFLIELHQGSWMGPAGQYGIHFMSGLGLFFLIISGIIIYPFKRKRI